MDNPSYRWPHSLSEFFGVDDYDVFHEAKNAQEQSEGYLAGVEYAKLVHEGVIKEFAGRSRTYREAVLMGLRETL